MVKLNLKILGIILKILSIVFFILLVIYSIFNQNVTVVDLFLNVYFILFMVTLVSFLVIQLYLWKESINRAESLIYEIVIYRKVTPINSLARKLNLTKDATFEILQKMIATNKIIGSISEGMFYSTSPRIPKCPICNEEIKDSLRIITCPFCRKPFHKDHLLTYMKEKEEKCPNCHTTLTLGDLFLD